MNDTLIQTINLEVYRRFPEINGAQPKISQRSGATTKSGSVPTTFLLTYQTSSALGDNKSLKRLVRVVVNEQGNIIKITTSR